MKRMFSSSVLTVLLLCAVFARSTVSAATIPPLLISGDHTNLVEISTTGEASVFYAGLPGYPRGIAFDAVGDLFVLTSDEEGEKRVLKIDAQSRTIVRTYILDADNGMDLVIRGNYAYVYNSWTSDLLKLDLTTGNVSVLEHDYVAANSHLAFGPDGMLYGANGYIERIDPETGWTVSLDHYSEGGLKFDESGHMYVSGSNSCSIIKVSAGDDGLFGTFDQVETTVLQTSDEIESFEVFNNQLIFSTNSRLVCLNLTNQEFSTLANLDFEAHRIIRRPIPNGVQGMIQIEQASIVAGEGANAIVSLVRSGGSEGAVSVDFRTYRGSAKGREDFLGTNGVITFLEGETQKSILIPIVNDAFAESKYPYYRFGGGGDFTEYFAFRISNPTGGATLGTQSGASIRIEDNDGQPNLLWRHKDGRLAIWEMKGTNKVSKFLLNNGQPINPIWRFAAFGDLNQDGRSDYLWQRNDGVVAGWFMNGTNIAGKFWLNEGHPIAWSLLAIADWNRDSHPDLLWRHSDGRVALWFMEETNRVSTTLLRPPGSFDPSWRFLGTYDVSRKGVPAFFWQNTDGSLRHWIMQWTGTELKQVVGGWGFPSNFFTPEGAGWLLRGFGSFVHLPHNDVPLNQNVDGRVAIRTSYEQFPETIYLNNGLPVAPDWRLLGSYPGSK